MSTRRDARMWAVQFLFQRDFNAGDLEEALTIFWSERKASTKGRKFTEDLVRGVEARRAEYDARIKEYAQNWDLHRMGGVERNAMRVALYEMECRPDIPPVVSVNEAVELCKEMSSDEAGKFANGLLDRALHDPKRPGRPAGVSKAKGAPEPEPAQE